MKKELPRIVCIIAGLGAMLGFFFEASFLQTSEQTLVNWGIIVAAFSLGTASINLTQRNLRRILKRQEGWWASVILLVSLFGMTILGLATSSSHALYKYWFAAVIDSSHAAMGSLIVFYIATAAFRAFRLRNVESGLLLGAGVIVLLGNAPIADLISPRLPALSNWLITVANVAGQRGIMISAGLGAVAASLRVIVGLDRQ